MNAITGGAFSAICPVLAGIFSDLLRFTHLSDRLRSHRVLPNWRKVAIAVRG
ncbi:MAG TPA: hypothetical protein V6D50_17610 [Chroococcales cyanobacterium]